MGWRGWACGISAYPFQGAKQRIVGLFRDVARARISTVSGWGFVSGGLRVRSAWWWMLSHDVVVSGRAFGMMARSWRCMVAVVGDRQEGTGGGLVLCSDRVAYL